MNTDHIRSQWKSHTQCGSPDIER